MKILLVDDNALMRRSMRRYLERLGMDIDEAETAAAGEELALANSYDLALLDVEMPERDGIELGLRLRAVLPHLPLAYVTGGDIEVARRRARPVEPLGVFAKADEIPKLVRLLLDLRDSQKRN